jgi:hypothetical protein
MTINTLDLLYLVLAIAALWIGAMLAWLLFEAALMAHRANRVVKDALQKVRRVEQMIMRIKDRLDDSSGYLSTLAEGGKTLLGFLHDRQVKSSSRKRGKKSMEDDDLEDEDEE